MIAGRQSPLHLVHEGLAIPFRNDNLIPKGAVMVTDVLRVLPLPSETVTACALDPGPVAVVCVQP